MGADVLQGWRLEIKKQAGIAISKLNAADLYFPWSGTPETVKAPWEEVKKLCLLVV